jgi:ParB-like chromosome segregation protein Spo0J
MRRYEEVDISKLKPYENNARTHSDEQVEKIAKSIQEFGFINPVLIDSDYGIIAGHGRLLSVHQN